MKRASNHNGLKDRRKLTFTISQRQWKRLQGMAAFGTKPEQWAARILTRAIENSDVEFGEPQTAL